MPNSTAERILPQELNEIDKTVMRSERDGLTHAVIPVRSARTLVDVYAEHETEETARLRERLALATEDAKNNAEELDAERDRRRDAETERNDLRRMLTEVHRALAGWEPPKPQTLNFEGIRSSKRP